MKFSNWFTSWFNFWYVGIVVGCFILAAPIGLVFVSVFFPQIEIWQHLYSTVLIDYIVNSLALAFGVGVLVIIIGTALAWCIARYEEIPSCTGSSSSFAQNDASLSLARIMSLFL